MKRILSTLTLSFLLLLPIVIAQSDLVSRGLVRGVLGPLPQACTFSLSSSDCIACLGQVKILPFTFFFGLTYFAMVFIVFRIFGGRPGEAIGRPEVFDLKRVTPSFYYAAILISIALGLAALHTRDVNLLFVSISQLQSILILVFSIVIVVTFLYAIHPLSPLLGMFVLLFSIGIVWTFYTNLTQPGGLLSVLPVIDIMQSPCFLLE